MVRMIVAGLLAVALAVTPAIAAKKSVKSKAAGSKKAVRLSVQDFERDAWGGAVPRRGVQKRIRVKKPAVARKNDEVKPTVTLNENKKRPPVAVKPVQTLTPTVNTTPKPETAATANSDSKTAEELEKAARSQKDPNKALTAYTQLLERNPNYAYAGDVYKNMFQLSQRNGSDTLKQLEFAGKAAKALEEGRSRGPVSPRDIQNMNRAADDLIQKWIQDTTRQLMSEGSKR